MSDKKKGLGGAKTDIFFQQQPAPAPKKETPKRKVTYYLTEDVLDRLDAAWLELRQQAGSDKTAINKSVIVEAALELALDALAREGTDSQLYDMLVSQNNSKPE